MVFKGIYSNQLVIFWFKIEFVQRKNLYILKFEEKNPLKCTNEYNLENHS